MLHSPFAARRLRVPLCAGVLHRSTTVRAALALRLVRAFEAGACSLISEAHVFPRAYGAAVAALCRHRPRARQLPALERGCWHESWRGLTLRAVHLSRLTRLVARPQAANAQRTVLHRRELQEHCHARSGGHVGKRRQVTSTRPPCGELYTRTRRPWSVRSVRISKAARCSVRSTSVAPVLQWVSVSSQRASLLFRQYFSPPGGL
jgi:hypothetical protein